jgi:hypothetical protein
MLMMLIHQLLHVYQQGASGASKMQELSRNIHQRAEYSRRQTNLMLEKPVHFWALFAQREMTLLKENLQ